jgi:hypothetical protein
LKDFSSVKGPKVQSKRARYSGRVAKWGVGPSWGREKIQSSSPTRAKSPSSLLPHALAGRKLPLGIPVDPPRSPPPFFDPHVGSFAMNILHEAVSAMDDGILFSPTF